jgi:hypothetical protein
LRLVAAFETEWELIREQAVERIEQLADLAGGIVLRPDVKWCLACKKGLVALRVM